MLRVQGLASSSPFDRDDPLSPANRRISIIVMNREAEDRLFRTAPPEPTPATPETHGRRTPVAVPPSTSAAPDPINHDHPHRATRGPT